MIAMGTPYKPNPNAGKRRVWDKPTGNPNDPPPEQGNIKAVLPRKGWKDEPDTEIHLTYNRMESGADYGRAQLWKKDDQGRYWPQPQAGITLRRDELPTWLEFLVQLRLEFDTHPKPEKQKPGGKP